MLHTRTWVHSQQSRVPESLQIAHFGVKSVFSAATFVAAKCTLRDINRCFPLEPFWREKCTFAGFMSCCDPAKCTFGDTSLCSHCELHFFWLQVCVSRCDFCRCKVYILGSSLCFQMQSISLQSVHFGIKSVFSAATFVAAKCTFLGWSLCFQMRLLSLQSVHFGIKSVFSDASFVTAKRTFWDQVCVFRCDLCFCKVYILGWSLCFEMRPCFCKVYILGSSLCFEMRPLSLQSVHFGVKSVFWDATFVATKCTFWYQVCVFRCDLCRCKMYILGSSLCFEMRPLSLQSVHFGIKFVFWDATFVAAKCTFWDQVCVLRIDLCRYKVYNLGSSLCFEMRPLSLHSVHFGIKSVFWDATFVAAKCTFCRCGGGDRRRGLHVFDRWPVHRHQRLLRHHRRQQQGVQVQYGLGGQGNPVW